MVLRGILFEILPVASRCAVVGRGYGLRRPVGLYTQLLVVEVLLNAS
ncbi:MAG: hypothetical protein JWL77_279 [Chthonomonadaceae bacterium]|nr:hypothetical protein [Chthonomonadaceae bacterium]